MEIAENAWVATSQAPKTPLQKIGEAILKLSFEDFIKLSETLEDHLKGCVDYMDVLESAKELAK